MARLKNIRVAIYTLNDPISGDVRYVGKTIKSLNDRLKIHLWNAANGGKSHRANWIRLLASQGLRPEIIQIEEVANLLEWAEREKYWIALYRNSGYKLTNATDGGEGWHGLKHSEESKKKISEVHKGKIISESHRKILSELKKGKTLSEETKLKISLAGIGRVVSEETKRKTSLTKKGKPAPNTTGEKNGRAKLTFEQVNEIKESVLKISEIMAKYNISKTQAYRIKRGEQWK